MAVRLNTNSPLVSRDAELERVLSHLSALAAGHRRLVFLDEEPGVGKSRLAREVLAFARADGARVFIGRCFEQHTAVPFFTFTELLGGILDALSRDQRGNAVDRWSDLAHLIPDPDPGREARYKPHGEDDQLRLFRTTNNFLRAAADDGPLVLPWRTCTEQIRPA